MLHLDHLDQGDGGDINKDDNDVLEVMAFPLLTNASKLGRNTTNTLELGPTSRRDNFHTNPGHG